MLKWKRVQGLAGLLLACTFFMPAVRACNSPVVPAEEAWGLVENIADPAGGDGLGDFLACFLVYCAAYIFGLLVLFSAVVFHRSRQPSKDISGISTFALLGAVVLILAVGLAAEIAGNASTVSIGVATIVLIVIASCAYWLRSVRMGAGGVLCIRWYAAICCIAWFSFWLFSGDAMYGLVLSWVASVAIAWACLQEARAWARRGVWGTFRMLVAGRLRIFDPNEPRCVKCGYLLVGLTAPRCPECGQGFTQDAEEGLPITAGADMNV